MAGQGYRRTRGGRHRATRLFILRQRIRHSSFVGTNTQGVDSGPKGMALVRRLLRVRLVTFSSDGDIFAPDHAANGLEHIDQTQYPDNVIVPGDQQGHEVSSNQLVHGRFKRTSLIDQFFLARCVQQILYFQMCRFIGNRT